MKNVFRVCVLWIILPLLLACNPPKPQREKLGYQRANVLLILVDDLNTWVGAMQAHPDAYNPNMDKLAAKGILFTNAHFQAPICGPSRASLLSGLYPTTTGIYGQIQDHKLRAASPAMEQVIFLSDYLEQQGYKTMGVGKIFHGGDGAQVFQAYGGFADYGPKPKERFHYDPVWFGKPARTQTDWGTYPANEEDMPDHKIADWAIGRLGEAHQEIVGFIRPHVPLYTTEKWFELFDKDTLTLPPYKADDWDDVPDLAKQIMDMPMMPTTEWMLKHDEYANVTQAYLACVAFVDHQIGRVLEALEKSAYAENTLVILTSDHGYHMGEKNRFAKHSLWERATHVPFVLAGPTLPKGQQNATAVGLIDIYPTVLDYCGLVPNTQNEGNSVLPFIQAPDPSRSILTTYGRNNHSLYQNIWHYIRYEDGAEELYNLAEDPNKWENKAPDSQYVQRKNTLRNYLPSENTAEAQGSRLSVNAYFRGELTQETHE